MYLCSMDKTLLQPTARDRFRLVGMLEGLSYLILLFVAMPMKYFLDLPLAVKYTGWAHGVLFVAYAFALLSAAVQLGWSFKKVVVAGLASLVPFGPFWLDKRVRNW